MTCPNNNWNCFSEISKRSIFQWFDSVNLWSQFPLKSKFFFRGIPWLRTLSYEDDNDGDDARLYKDLCSEVFLCGDSERPRLGFLGQAASPLPTSCGHGSAVSSPVGYGAKPLPKVI